MINRLAREYDWTLGTLATDIFRDHPTEYRQAVRDVLGYDGVQVNFPSGEKHFIAWFPNQIKHATENSGAFSPNDNRIRYSISEPTDAQQHPQGARRIRKTAEPSTAAPGRGGPAVLPGRGRQTPSGRKPAWSGRRTMAGGSLLTPPRRRRMMAAERQISKEAQTMAKTPPFEEFMEKMYGGGKQKKPTQEDLDRLKEEMRQVARRMKEEGVQPPLPGQEDV